MFKKIKKLQIETQTLNLKCFFNSLISSSLASTLYRILSASTKIFLNSSLASITGALTYKNLNLVILKFKFIL
jgi:hypothetical protein